MPSEGGPPGADVHAGLLARQGRVEAALLQRVHTDDMRLAVACARPGHRRRSRCRCRSTAHEASGTLRFVDAGPVHATHLVLAAGQWIARAGAGGPRGAGGAHVAGHPRPGAADGVGGWCRTAAAQRGAHRRLPSLPADAAGRAAAAAAPAVAGACARRGATRVRAGGRLRQGTAPVRPAHRPLPGRAAQAGQRADRARRGA
jgi:hypothetical protein